MIDLVDGMTLEALGHRYSDDERDTAVFAVTMHRDQSMAGNITYEGVALHDSIEVADSVLEHLRDGLEVVTAPVHQILGSVYLPYLVAMHEGLPTGLYERTCTALHVTPFQLFWHGLSARQMLDASAGLELV